MYIILLNDFLFLEEGNKANSATTANATTGETVTTTTVTSNTL